VQNTPVEEEMRKMLDISTEDPGMMNGFDVSPAYEIREVRMDQDLSAIISGWKECNARFADHTIVCDPKWLQQRYKLEEANILVHLLERNETIAGAVPLELYRHRLACQLGDLTVARIPLKMFRLLGYTPNLPPEESAHDLLFKRLLAFEFDAIYMTCIKVDSFFWHYLHDSPLIKKHSCFHSVRGIWPHPFIRMTGSFDDYMWKFSSKSRHNLSWQIRKLREKGKVELVRITEEQEVNRFVEAAVNVSRKTYQFRILRMGIGSHNPDQLTEWLKWAARRGWLRSYLLKCGGVPCAFQVAYKYNCRFLGIEVGYDLDWRKLRVGIIQHLLAVEDLFKENAPETCDFGSCADYKQFLANDAHQDALVWLFRRGPCPPSALSAYRLFDATSKTASTVPDRLNLKSNITHLLRGSRKVLKGGDSREKGSSAQETKSVSRELRSLTVIIPTKDRPVDLERTVRSVLQQTVLPQQLIIVDQSADGESRLRVQVLFDAVRTSVRDHLKLCYEMDPLIPGLAVARNRAMKLAEGDVWLFLDDDVILEPNFLKELLSVYSQRPHAGGVSGIVTNYRRPPWFPRLWRALFLRGPFRDERQTLYWRANRLRNAEPIRVDRLGGGLMSFRADVIRGYRFDDRLRGVSDGEDVDFCVRLKPDTILMIAPRARLEHKQSPSGRLQVHHLHRDVRSQYYLYRKNWRRGTKNRLYFAWLNVGLALQATLGSVRRGSLEPWRALLAGVQDARMALRTDLEPRPWKQQNAD
jgi:glucosyl-dolichyl phosphate glucuronosyltransferase